MLTSLVSLQQGNVKKSKKLMKIANFDEENLHIFWTSWGFFVKFSGKMWLMIVLKVTKNRASRFLWKTHFWKNHRWCSNWHPAFSELIPIQTLISSKKIIKIPMPLFALLPSFCFQDQSMQPWKKLIKLVLTFSQSREITDVTDTLATFAK